MAGLFDWTVDAARCYALLWMVSLAGGVLLEPTVNYFRVAAELFGLNAAIYWIHRLLHWLPSWTSPHLAWHHDKSLDIPRPLELAIEFVTNLSWFAGLWLLQRAAGVNVFHTRLIAFVALWYSSQHVINMSLWPNDYHRLHHTNHDVNFGPPYMDQLFGTYAGDSCYDINNSVINGWVSFYLVERWTK
jgi:hypothetical protein